MCANPTKPKSILLIMLLLLFTVFINPPAIAQSNEPRLAISQISVDNVSIQFEHPPIVQNNRVLVDGECIAIALQMKLQPISNDQTILFVRDNAAAQFYANSRQAIINGNQMQIDVSPVRIADTCYIPLRQLAEACGAYVAWDEKSRSIRILSNDSIAYLQGISAQVVGKSTAEEVNRWWKENKGYDQPPYKPGTWVTELVLTQDTTFARVYDGKISGKFGGWVMKSADISGLTQKQIQNLFALPAMPVYQVDVSIKAGTHLHTGITNTVVNWGDGGGIQFDLMGQRTGDFVNERPLP